MAGCSGSSSSNGDENRDNLCYHKCIRERHTKTIIIVYHEYSHETLSSLLAQTGSRLRIIPLGLVMI